MNLTVAPTLELHLELVAHDTFSFLYTPMYLLFSKMWVPACVSCFTCCNVLLPAATAVLAYFVAAVSPNMDVANAALPTYVAILLYFGGFMITFDKIPPWWKWFSFINPLRLALH
jgi:hypothetical protein